MIQNKVLLANFNGQLPFLGLAAVMELYSRKIIGWSMGSSMPSDLVCSALQMALNARKPQSGLIMHINSCWRKMASFAV
jgi:transposase InsO family protein